VFCLQDDGKRPREALFQNPESIVGNMNVFRGLLDGSANHTHGLELGFSFNLVEPLDGIFVEDAAPDPVHRIRGIDNNPAIFQNIHRTMDDSDMRIFYVNLMADHPVVSRIELCYVLKNNHTPLKWQIT